MLKAIREKIGEKREQEIFKFLLNALFQIHKRFYRAKIYNYPNIPCVFALWHAHQCGLYSLPDLNKLNAMISKSKDGNIIAYAAEKLGFKTIRGSYQREGGVTSVIEMINVLKKGECGAITIDGPRGPKHVAKKGIIEIARKANVPIVPMMWHGDFIKFNTWDEFCYPIPLKMTVTIFGEPIYVPTELDKEGVEYYRKMVEDELNKLHEKIVNEFDKLKR